MLLASRRWCSTVADSLRAANLMQATATELRLPASPDLQCTNMMCQHLGEACLCKLAVSLQRMQCLERLDVSNNGLKTLPDAVFDVPTLRVLDVRGNELTSLPEDALRRLPHLEELHADDNALEEVPAAALSGLQVFTATGNPLSDNHKVELTAALEAAGVDVRV